MSPDEAARVFAEAARRLPQAVLEAEKKSLEALKKAAIKRSQGPLQHSDLRRLNHPYARRRLRLNPDIINKWVDGGGEVERGWEVEGPKREGDTIRSALSNSSIRAAGLEQGLVFGQPVMEPRSPHLAAYEDVRGEREERLADVWESVLR